MRNLKYFCVLIYLLLTYSKKANAQNDSLSVVLSAFASYSNSNYNSLYLEALNHGMVSPNRSNLYYSTYINYHSEYNQLKNTFLFRPVASLDPEYSQINELAYKGILGPFIFNAGRFRYTSGTVDTLLTSGSLGISGNARPIPMVQGGVENFSMPFTKNIFSITAKMSHGWLNGERAISSALLHHKELYGRLDLPFKGDFDLNIYGGWSHYVIWGGDSEYGSIEESIPAFWRVVRGKGEEIDNAVSIGEVTNAAGSHILLADYGGEIAYMHHKWKIYLQSLYEDRSSITRNFLTDGMLGISYRNDKGSFLKGCLVEIIKTDYQSGPGIPDSSWHTSNYGHDYAGRDDYYNNHLYRTGWSTYSKSIGTPLFYSKARIDDVLDTNFINYDREMFVNNRVRAVHFGLFGSLFKIDYKLRFTYTENYGSYSGYNQGRFNWKSKTNPEHVSNYFFTKTKVQYYTCLSLEKKINRNITLSTDIALDFGDIYHSSSYAMTFFYSL